LQLKEAQQDQLIFRRGQDKQISDHHTKFVDQRKPEGDELETRKESFCPNAKYST